MMLPQPPQTQQNLQAAAARKAMSKGRYKQRNERSLPRRTTQIPSDEEQGSAGGVALRNFLNTRKKDRYSYEELQNIVGGNGLWQSKVALLASLSGLCSAMHNLIYAFIGATPDHWCPLPNITGYTFETLQHELIPVVGDVRSKCLRFDYSRDYGNQSLAINKSATVRCESMVYNTTDFKQTIPMQWDLVCEDAGWIPSIQVAYIFGMLLGIPILGLIADRYGRKSAILIGTVISVLAGPMVAYSQNLFALIVFRLILGFGTPGVYSASYILAQEIVSDRRKCVASSHFNLPFAMGYMILPILAYFIRDWRDLQLAISLPSVGLLITWCYLPESPRWLIRKGKWGQAEYILHKAAQKNEDGQNIPWNFSEMIRRVYDKGLIFASPRKLIGNQVDQTASSELGMMKVSKLRLQFIILCLSWFTIGTIYYGLAFNYTNVNENVYTYMLIGGILEFPAYLAVPHMIRRCGQKPVYVFLLLTCGTTLLITLIVSSELLLDKYLAYIGKFLITGVYSFVYLYSSEIMPEFLRTWSVTIYYILGTTGSILAPVIVDSAEHTKSPLVIFGSLAIVTGMLGIFLPETSGQIRKETTDDYEMNYISTGRRNEPQLRAPQIQERYPLTVEEQHLQPENC